MNALALLLAVQVAAPPADSARIAAVARLAQGSTIRLKGPGVGVIDVKLRSPAGDTITVGRWLPERRVALAGVDSIWVRHDGTGTGALFGAVVGALFFGHLGSQLAGMCDSANCTNHGFIVGGAFGIMIGGSIGAIVGSMQHDYELIYP